MSAKRALQQCQEAVNTRKFCYSTSQRELGGEDCLIEELTEKRCLSFMLCPKEAKDYYGSKDGDKAVCALYKEAFAFAREDARVDEGTKELHANAAVRGEGDKALSQACRARGMNLVHCPSNYASELS